MDKPDSPGIRRELSRRQKEVVLLILTGETAKGIAAQLDLSIHTVREHFQLIYKKLGVHGREELMAMFITKDAIVKLNSEGFASSSPLRNQNGKAPTV